MFETSDISIDGQNVPTSERLNMALEFFQRIPEKWFKHICWLSLRGRYFEHAEGHPDSDCYEIWVALASTIKRRSSISQLAFELDYYGDTHWLGYGVDVPEGKEPAFKESIWNIVKLFKPKDGQQYKDFFVRIAHCVPSEEEDWARWQLEKDLECHIMGEHYNATTRGKYDDKRFHNESLRPKRYMWNWSDMEDDDERLSAP